MVDTDQAALGRQACFQRAKTAPLPSCAVAPYGSYMLTNVLVAFQCA